MQAFHKYSRIMRLFVDQDSKNNMNSKYWSGKGQESNLRGTEPSRGESCEMEFIRPIRHLKKSWDAGWNTGNMCRQKTNYEINTIDSKMNCGRRQTHAYECIAQTHPAVTLKTKKRGSKRASWCVSALQTFAFVRLRQNFLLALN